MARLIEDYGLIGDGETAALVHRNGSIDWLCWPRFDSDACFSALLGTAEHGCWRISPVAPACIERRYQATISAGPHSQGAARHDANRERSQATIRLRLNAPVAGDQ